MRERPILFSAPMVRAILKGRKTVTRRVVKRFLPLADMASEVQEHYELLGWLEQTPGHLVQPCPYGQPGDRLWVRESLGYDAEYGHYFKAGGRHGETVHLCELFDEPAAETGYSYDGNIPDRGIPSIHLPRRYSRITLEVTGVRVERLQAISDADCEAEGVRPSIDGTAQDWRPDESGWRRTYRQLWESINGADSWDANPWVWVIEFKRLERAAA